MSYYAFFKSEACRTFACLDGFRRIIGSAELLTVSSVMITFSTVGSLGIVNIRLFNTPSSTLLSPLAPVFLSRVISAIASSASYLNSRDTSSSSKSFVYCLTIEFLGSVIILISASLSRLSRTVTTGILPINSGIRPYLTRSC